MKESIKAYIQDFIADFPSSTIQVFTFDRLPKLVYIRAISSMDGRILAHARIWDLWGEK